MNSLPIGPIETHVKKELLEQLLLPLMGHDIARVEISLHSWSDVKDTDAVPVKLYRQLAEKPVEEGTVLTRINGRKKLRERDQVGKLAASKEA